MTSLLRLQNGFDRFDKIQKIANEAIFARLRQKIVTQCVSLLQ